MKKKVNTIRLTFLAMFAAILCVMSFTPIGYLKVGAVSITFLTLPVVLGACMLGTGAGAILGLIFGITSFIQCFGLDAFGTLLLSVNPFLTFIMCVFPRVMIGVFASLVYKAVPKKDTISEIASYTAASFVGSATNTVLFVGLLVGFFFGSDPVSQNLGSDISTVILALVTVNALIELGVNIILTVAVMKALSPVVNRILKQNS